MTAFGIQSAFNRIACNRLNRAVALIFAVAGENRQSGFLGFVEVFAPLFVAGRVEVQRPAESLCLWGLDVRRHVLSVRVFHGPCCKHFWVTGVQSMNTKADLNFFALCAIKAPVIVRPAASLAATAAFEMRDFLHTLSPENDQ